MMPKRGSAWRSREHPSHTTRPHARQWCRAHAICAHERSTASLLSAGGATAAAVGALAMALGVEGVGALAMALGVLAMALGVLVAVDATRDSDGAAAAATTGEDGAVLGGRSRGA